jgi:hypothetical protein
MRNMHLPVLSSQRAWRFSLQSSFARKYWQTTSKTGRITEEFRDRKPNFLPQPFVVMGDTLTESKG